MDTKLVLNLLSSRICLPKPLGHVVQVCGPWTEKQNKDGHSWVEMVHVFVWSLIDAQPPDETTLVKGMGGCAFVPCAAPTATAASHVVGT